MKPHVFIEQLDISEAVIDQDNRILRDVVLIRAGDSANRRTYPVSVLENAVSVFEGVKAYANHPTGNERSIRDITGFYKNVRFADNKLVADRYFIETSAGMDAWEIAKRIAMGEAPRSLAGLSINAVGEATRRDDGWVDVQAITGAESVDDVTTPAAGGSYIESVTPATLTQALIEALDYDEWLNMRPEYKERFEKENRKVRRNAQLTAVTEARDKYAQRSQELQAQVKALQEERDHALAQAAEAQRLVLVTDTLAKVKLPVQWKDSLKRALMEAQPEQWPAIIDAEISKANSAGHKPRVPVNVPPPQVNTLPVMAVHESLAPRDDETPAQYAARMQRLRKGS